MNGGTSSGLDRPTALVTGARRGIGRAVAIALRRGGRRRDRRQREPRAGRGDVGREVEARGRRFTAYAATSPIAAPCTPSSTRSPAARRRHPGEQRRHHRRAPAAEHGRRLGRRPRGEPQRAVRADARARPGHARARPREDRLHRVAALVPGRHQRPRLRGQPRAASPGSPRRSPTNGRRAASTSTRSRRATSTPTTRRRSATTRRARGRSSSASRQGAGAAGGHRRRGGVPRLAARRLRHGVVLPSTAAGSAR